MNRKLNVLLVNNENDNDYNNQVSSELIRYYNDISQVFVIKNNRELLKKLENTNIHIIVLYLNMKCNKKIIQYLKDIQYTNRLHIIGVYKNDIEVKHCSYINDCDILIKEDKDLKIFCFQLFYSYKNNTEKYTTIEEISEVEKQQEHKKYLYNRQQLLLETLHNSKKISKYQKLVDSILKKMIILKIDISYEILNSALLITYISKDEINLELLIYVLIAEFSMNASQIKSHLRLSIKRIFNIPGNHDYLANMFDISSSKLPHTIEFLTTLINYSK